MLTFSGGRAVLLACGLRAPEQQFCEVVGEEGVSPLPRPLLPGEDPALIFVRRKAQEERIEIPGTDQYARMIDHFGECVLTGGQPHFPPEDAVAKMRGLDLLRAGAPTGGLPT